MLWTHAGHLISLSLSLPSFGIKWLRLDDFKDSFELQIPWCWISPSITLSADEGIFIPEDFFIFFSYFPLETKWLTQIAPELKMGGRCQIISKVDLDLLLWGWKPSYWDISNFLCLSVSPCSLLPFQRRWCVIPSSLNERTKSRQFSAQWCPLEPLTMLAVRYSAHTLLFQILKGQLPP